MSKPLHYFLIASAICSALTLGACSSQRYEVVRTPSEAWSAPADTALGKAAASQLALYPTQSGFRLLDAGMDALSMRAGLAEGAQHTLDLQYYTLHEDTTTQLLIYRVLRAAHRGVRVRLLVDDLYAVGKDLDLAALSADPNIEVRVYNPFMLRGAWGLSRLLEFVGDVTRLNRRMHNKLWIADNAAAIVGGRNLGDAYFDASADFNFSDLDVLAVGPVVRELSQSFDDYWNNPLSVPIEAFVKADADPQQPSRFERQLEARLQTFRDTAYARALRETRLGPQLLAGQLPLTPAPAVALYDPPAKDRPVGEAAPGLSIFSDRLRAIIKGAQHEIILISPYFIPSDEGVGILSAAAKRGVHVRLLTNSLASTDVPVVHAGYAQLRPQLLDAGIELHERLATEQADAKRNWRLAGSSSASLHTKAIVVDRRTVLIGSMNLDPRSRRINTEVAVLMESADLGSRLGSLFDEAVLPSYAFQLLAVPGPQGAKVLNWVAEMDGKAVRYETEPASVWRRFWSQLLHLLTPGEML